MKNRKFVDRVTVHVRGGRGGNGCCSFRREKFVPLGGPDGGDGGRGGHVVFRGDRNADSLVSFYYRPRRFAPNGGHGRGSRQHGRNGADLVVATPVGTCVRRAENGELLADITEHDQAVVIARGGRGGLGNPHWKSSVNQAPRDHTPGEEGEEATLLLELKIIADVSLVGFPNAGKSSLLTRLSDAHPRVAAYPFTTLHPVIGTIDYPDYRQVKVADVPGLIEGAHRGVGLGHDFLRHIERSRGLLMVIDMAGVDGRAPWDDWHCLREELRRHSPDLARRPFLTLANKMDLAEATENLAEFTARTGASPMPVSTATGKGIDSLKIRIREISEPRQAG